MSELKGFPSTSVEALAYLYVQNQDISDLSPSELFDLYQKAKHEIEAHKDANTDFSVAVL